MRSDAEIRAALLLHRQWPTREVHEARTRLGDDVEHLMGLLAEARTELEHLRALADEQSSAYTQAVADRQQHQ